VRIVDLRMVETGGNSHDDRSRRETCTRWLRKTPFGDSPATTGRGASSEEVRAVMSAPVGHRGDGMRRGSATWTRRASPGTRESRRAAAAHT
jgi:hypothetical protein